LGQLLQNLSELRAKQDFGHVDDTPAQWIEVLELVNFVR
jgi:hypothetical protein